MTRRVTATEAERSTALREPIPLDDYQRGVANALTKAFEADETEEQELDLDTARIVVFSDHHKGGRDGADDFRGCERAYTAALAYYLETGFRPFALGDVEELWECPAQEVIHAYRETLELEGQFHAAGRYERFWGNHDHHWRDADQVVKYLEDLLPGIRVREALKLGVVRGRECLGLLFRPRPPRNRRQRPLRLVVPACRAPPLAALQRRLDMRSSTASRDFQLRRGHDAAMFTWASTHPASPVLVPGHTHRPVLWTSEALVEETESGLAQQLEALRSSSTATPEQLGMLRARLEFVRAELP